MTGWRIMAFVVNVLANVVVSALLLIPGFVFGFVGGLVAMYAFGLPPRQAAELIGVLWFVPSVLYLVVALASWIDARVRTLRLRGTTLQVIGHDPSTAILDPLVADVARAGFVEVARVRRTQWPIVLLVSADGILAAVSPVPGAGVRRARPAADGTPAAILLVNPVVLGAETETAHLITGHASTHLRRWTTGPLVVQHLPDGDPRAMVARHRATAAIVADRGLGVVPVRPEVAVAELDRFQVQQRAVVVGTMAWLLALQRRGHEGVSGAIDVRAVDKQVAALLGLLTRAEQRVVRARIQLARAAASRPMAPPPAPAGIPSALPDGPPSSWPDGAWG